MLSNDEIREKVGYPYSNELIELLREWYEPFLGRRTSDDLIITNLALDSLNSPKLKMFEIINSYMSIAEKSVLEVGFGSGQCLANLGRFGAKRVTGIDIRNDLFRMAFLRCKDIGITPILLEGDVLIYDFKEMYDIILCWQVLEHNEKYKQKPIIKKLYSMLNPGGILFIQVPNYSCLIDSHDSKLPFAHWLPRSLGKRYANMFNRISPEVNPIKYSVVLSSIKELDGAEVLNHVDVCRNLSEFIKYRLCRRGAQNKLIAVLGSIFYCITIGHLQNFLPNVNLIVRKKSVS